MRRFRRILRSLPDPDYSPAYQDEYQRLWHEAAAERDRLRKENGRLALETATADQDWKKAEADCERLGLRVGELEHERRRALADFNHIKAERDRLRKTIPLVTDGRFDAASALRHLDEWEQEAK